ncbi:MAG TPA: response regulator [Dictyobacter sp.]|jgi:response regulator NasT|nr:response regulator [Dictyobacter sp.]
MTVRVLVAEDDSIQRMELTTLLTEQGYLVIGEATDGQSVIELAHTLRPDLVLMDIHLPDKDGISVTATLSQEQIAPVILLSAFSDMEFVEKAKAAGVFHYCIKPLRENEIKPVIEMALARYQARQVQEEQWKILSEQLEARKRAEREKGREIEKRQIEESRKRRFEERQRWIDGEWNIGDEEE